MPRHLPRFLFPTLLFLAPFISFAVPSLTGDLEILRARLATEWLANVDVPAAQSTLAAQSPEGSWPDIDYADNQGTNWPHLQHIERASLLARAYCQPGSALARDPAVRIAIARAWEFWFARDFTNVNWWYNEIGIPRTLATGLVLLRDELTPRELEQGIRILARAKIQAESQNLVWLAEINALRGLLAADEALVARAYARIAAEIRVVTPGAEGLQADFSLLQHRRCLYNHGYGASFAVDGTRLARLLSGTRFALPPERIALLENLLLDGSQWMGLGPWQDWAARGREIARIGRGLGTYQAAAAENLLALTPPSSRAAELGALVARIREQPDAPPLSGARHFWRADFTVLQRPGFYASVRTFSSRLANTDFNGPENLLGHHLADGATTLMARGGEYASIFPLWNWQRLPGVTARQTPPLTPGSPRRENGSRDFAGGVSDGSAAFAAFDFERDGLAARKAWFLTDAGLLALGTGLSDSENHPVATTLNQCLLRGLVVTESNPVASSTTWLWHDGLAYVSLDGASLHHEAGPRTSSWRAIHQNLPATPITGDLFTVWLDHGSAPRNASYAYLVAPATDAAATRALGTAPRVRILANTPTLQAAAQPADGLLGAAFYAPGELDLGASGVLAVDQPCLVLLHRLPDGSTELSVADPTAKLTSVNVRLGPTRADFILPSGPDAGRTVTRALPR